MKAARQPKPEIQARPSKAVMTNPKVQFVQRVSKLLLSTSPTMMTSLSCQTF